MTLTTPPPFRFIGLVCAAWIALRVAVFVVPLPFLAHVGPHLLDDNGHFPLEFGDVAAGDLPATIAQAAPARSSAAAPAPSAGHLRLAMVRSAALTVLGHSSATFGAFHAAVMQAEAEAAESARADHPKAGSDRPIDVAPIVEGGALAPVAPVGTSASHWSGSAWAYVRGGGTGALATDGELGGSQAGARIAYRFDPAVPVAAFGRVASALAGSPDAEAAIGLDWQPAKALPVRLSVERRIAINHGGRNAFAAMAVGGVDDKPLPLGGRLDGYVQAGVVGAEKRDLFIDGGIRAGRPFDITADKRTTVTVGVGLWGAAQPHVSRIDIGPSVALRLPMGKTGVIAAADWRFRVVGDARPGSGPALTVGIDF